MNDRRPGQLASPGLQLHRTARTEVTADLSAATVTKTCLAPRGARRRQALHELRVNRLLLDEPPPFPFARMLASDRRRPTMTFERVGGDLYGPKFPLDLAGGLADVDALAALARSTAAYRPRRRWLPRYAVRALIGQTERSGLVTASEAAALRSIHPGPFVFAHGDITPRNVVRSPVGPTLIDFEWGGWYPPLYELAFLWFVLVDIPAARERIEEMWLAPDERGPFVFAALLVQLRHMQMWHDARPEDLLRPRQRATREALMTEVLDGLRPGIAGTGSASGPRA